MDPNFFAALFDAARRSHRDDHTLLSGMRDRLWPGGHDRSEPVARTWVRSWGPRTMPVTLGECACATGRCGTCN